jgi:hypothetical protein
MTPGQLPLNPRAGRLPGQLPGQLPGVDPTGQQGVGTQPGGLQGGPFQVQQQGGGFNTAGAPGVANNQAINAINNALTQPASSAGSAFNNNLTGGGTGLAGVASTNKGPSIKVYKERSKYSEWEFIFDLKQGLPGQQTQLGAQGQPQQQQGTGTNQGSTSQSGFGFGSTPATPAPTTKQ